MDYFLVTMIGVGGVGIVILVALYRLLCCRGKGKCARGGLTSAELVANDDVETQHLIVPRALTNTNNNSSYPTRFGIRTELIYFPPPVEKCSIHQERLQPTSISRPPHKNRLENDFIEQEYTEDLWSIGRREEAIEAAARIKQQNIDARNQIDEIQENLQESADTEKDIREVQKLIKEKIQRSPKLMSSFDCSLIICVDATPSNQAGYCINLTQKRLYYYVVQRRDFPWKLGDPKDASEFEMKNLMFAVTLWRDLILKHKKFRIYTDNHSINQHNRADSKYGNRAFQLLHHYMFCEQGPELVNWDRMVVNRFKHVETFARYIQPADDLSRYKIDWAVDFLCEIYGIEKENVDGTHQLRTYNPPDRANANSKGIVR